MDLLALYLKGKIVDDETYVMLTNELSAILKDIVNAIQNEDEVLMLDSH
ncbi:MAG: hypothetical protein ACLT2Z_09750 [Eubacterium sp.]